MVLGEWYYEYCLGPEYHIPRGSYEKLSTYASVLHCTPVPGEHICHKPLPPVYKDPTDPHNPLWLDSVYQIAQHFGVEWRALCAYNQMKNCSAVNYACGSALKIPVPRPVRDRVRPLEPQQEPRN